MNVEELYADKFVSWVIDKFEKMDSSYLARQFVKNLSFRIFSNILTKGVSFLLIMWLTRELSPDDFGLYSFAISLAGFFVVFGNLGVTVALLKVVPEKLAQGDEGVASWVLGGLKLMTLGSLVSFLFLSLASPFLALYVFGKPFVQPVIVLAGGFLFLMVISGFFDSLFIAIKRNDLCFCSVIVKEVSRVLFIVLLVSAGLSFFGALYGYILSFFVFLLVALSLFLWKYAFLFKGKSLSVHKVFSYSKWFMALGVFTTILAMMDILMISIFMPIRYTGYYTVVVSIVSALMLLIPISRITLPFFSEVSGEHLESRFRKIFYPTVVITFVVAVVLAVTSKPLLAFFYPVEYAENAWIALSVLAFVVPVRNAFWLSVQRLIVLGKIRDQLWITGLAAFVNLVLNVLFIPLFGLPGAAFATVLSLVVGFGLVIQRGRWGWLGDSF